jgi:hypothetical protein
MKYREGAGDGFLTAIDRSETVEYMHKLSLMGTGHDTVTLSTSRKLSLWLSGKFLPGKNI